MLLFGVRPFGIDDLPGHAGLKDGSAHELEVIIKGLGVIFGGGVSLLPPAGVGRDDTICEVLVYRSPPV